VHPALSWIESRSTWSSSGSMNGNITNAGPGGIASNYSDTDLSTCSPNVEQHYSYGIRKH
jgi:hypothetical protein